MKDRSKVAEYWSWVSLIKKDVSDMRESPSVEIMKLLADRGASIQYSDPHVPVFPKMRQYSFDLVHTEVTAEVLSSQDCVVIATDHSDFDYE